MKRRLSDEYSLRSEDNDVEEVPPDVSAFLDMQKHGGFSPTHEIGHLTPGHVVGRPIHESPEHSHHELPPEFSTTRDTSQFQDGASKVHSHSLV
jgi:hypothetical protein